MNSQEHKKTISEIYTETVELIEGSMKYLPFCRDIELQREAAENLLALIPWIKSAKYTYAEQGEEKQADNFLYLQCSVYAVASMLKAIISIKKSEYKEAWDLIIDAEEYISVGLRTAPQVDFLNSLSKNREMIEKVLLPEMPFYNSIGAIVTGGKCNICNQEYSVCEHIEGFIYSGTVCRLVKIRDLKMDHSAIVEEPRDRRCIPLEFEADKDNWRDIFTWKLKPRKEENADDKGMGISMTLFHNKHIDTD